MDLVFTITWTKTRKFLKRRFSKRPDKFIPDAIQVKLISKPALLTHQVGGKSLLLICGHLVKDDVTYDESKVVMMTINL